MISNMCFISKHMTTADFESMVVQIPQEVRRNLSSTHWLHHLMKVKKLYFSFYRNRITKIFFNFRRKVLERLTFCNQFYENRRIGFVDMAICIFLNVGLWRPPFCKPCHVTKIKEK